MKTIIKIALPDLRDEEYFQFFTAFKTLAQQSGLGEVNLGTLYTVFSSLLKRLDNVLEQIRESGLADSFTELNDLRDNLHRGITRCIGAYICHFDHTLLGAAGRLRSIAGHYGNFHERANGEETAAVTSLVKDLHALDNDMKAILVYNWVEKLDEANRHFDEVMNERFVESASTQQMARIRTIRADMDANYRTIVQVLEAFYIAMPDEPAYGNFIDEWNVHVRYYNRIIRLRKAENKSVGQPSDENEGEILSTI